MHHAQEIAEFVTLNQARDGFIEFRWAGNDSAADVYEVRYSVVGRTGQQLKGRGAIEMRARHGQMSGSALLRHVRAIASYAPSSQAREGFIEFRWAGNDGYTDFYDTRCFVVDRAGQQLM
jgi:hypothetical protein